MLQPPSPARGKIGTRVRSGSSLAAPDPDTPQKPRSADLSTLDLDFFGGAASRGRSNSHQPAPLSNPGSSASRGSLATPDKKSGRHVRGAASADFGTAAAGDLSADADDPFLQLAQRKSSVDSRPPLPPGPPPRRVSNASPPVAGSGNNSGGAPDSPGIKARPPSSPVPAHVIAARHGAIRPVAEESADGKNGEDDGDEHDADRGDFDEVQKSNRALFANQRNPRVVRIKVDVLGFMKKGTPFLKYGKFGYPHFRQFYVNESNTALVWFSASKKLSETQSTFHRSFKLRFAPECSLSRVVRAFLVSIEDIDEIVLGQTTPIFAKHPSPELEKYIHNVFAGSVLACFCVVSK